MWLVFSLVFVAGAKIIYDYNFVAPLKKADKFNMQHQLYAYWMNWQELGEADLKNNNSRQYIHTALAVLEQNSGKI